MTYEAVTNVEWLDKPTEAFEYNGYHFEGVGTLRDNSFLKVCKAAHCDGGWNGIGLRKENLYRNASATSAKGWNYNEFYETAKTEGIGNINIFRCVENDLLYIPSEDELLRYE